MGDVHEFYIGAHRDTILVHTLAHFTFCPSILWRLASSSKKQQQQRIYPRLIGKEDFFLK